MYKENLTLPKAFIAKQEEQEEQVHEEETSEDEALNVKGLMALVDDSPDDICDTDGSHA